LRSFLFFGLELGPEYPRGFFVLLQQAGEKIGGADVPQTFGAGGVPTELDDQILVQGQQLGKRVIRGQIDARVGGRTGGLTEAENIVHRIEG